MAAPEALSEADLKKALAPITFQRLSQTLVAEELEVSRHTVWRALSQEAIFPADKATVTNASDLDILDLTLATGFTKVADNEVRIVQPFQFRRTKPVKLEIPLGFTGVNAPRARAPRGANENVRVVGPECSEPYVRDHHHVFSVRRIKLKVHGAAPLKKHKKHQKGQYESYGCAKGKPLPGEQKV